MRVRGPQVEGLGFRVWGVGRFALSFFFALLINDSQKLGVDMRSWISTPKGCA